MWLVVMCRVGISRSLVFVWLNVVVSVFIVDFCSFCIVYE